jgi:hypothetical protein
MLLSPREEGDMNKTKEEWLTTLQDEIDDLHCDIYFTATFKSRTLAESAEKAFKYFLKCRLNQPGKTFFKKFVMCWAFFDKVDKRGGIHIHALLKNIDPSLAPSLQEKCKEFFGQSDVRPYDHSLPKHRSASHYLAEKVVRGELDHYDFYKINCKFRR